MSFSRPDFSPVFAAHAQHGDALRLFVELFNLIRPPNAHDAIRATQNHLALVELLESDAEKCRQARQAMIELLTTRQIVTTLTDSGILPPTGFFSETLRIASHRLLPEIPDPGDFRDCLRQILHKPNDWLWLSALPEENTIRFWRSLAPHTELTPQQKALLFEQFQEAILVLAYRISGQDLDQELRRLGDSLSGYSAAFRAVAGEAQRSTDAWRAAMQAGEPPEMDERHLLVLIDQCHAVIDKAHRTSKRIGTSLALSFALRRAKQRVKRLEVLVTLLGIQSRENSQDEALAHWALIIRRAIFSENRRNSLRHHISQGMGLLALRVSDNAAKSGEHYITETRSAYFAMWRSAMGAGVIIAMLALLKIFTSKLDLAPIGYAFFYSLIYGLGFALIYSLHLTIATKQPAMTAQTLAGFIGEAERGRQEELERLVDLIAAVVRSQFAAIIGNVAVALPTAIVVGLAWQYFTGHPIIDTHKGELLLADLDPLGWALPHAAIAGVFLFFSGIISGYFDNLANYARIGDRVARLGWLNALLGSQRAASAGAYIDAHLGGLSGNFLFGCMLGSAGTVGIILGLPIDIRHIAFSSANFGYALTAFSFDLPIGVMLWSSLGIALIGFVNLSVSFSLALWMALRARDVTFTQTRGLLKTLWKRLRNNFRSFIAAPVDQTAKETNETNGANEENQANQANQEPPHPAEHGDKT